MLRPELPLTPESALAWARESARSPEEVRRFPHAEFEDDHTCGGLAFADSRTLYVAAYDGTFGTSLLEHMPPQRQLDEWLARSRHAHRDLSWDELGPWQQVAVTAIRRDTTPGGLADPRLLTDADRNWADWLWIRLRRAGRDPLRTLAADDSLMSPPRPAGRKGPTMHPCPLCGRPARHQDRYPQAVCDECSERSPGP